MVLAATLCEEPLLLDRSHDGTHDVGLGIVHKTYLRNDDLNIQRGERNAWACHFVEHAVLGTPVGRYSLNPVFEISHVGVAEDRNILKVIQELCEYFVAPPWRSLTVRFEVGHWSEWDSAADGNIVVERQWQAWVVL